FILTDPTAKAQDVKDLIETVKNRVYDKTGIILEEEVETLGKFR
ncbi:MAG: UDP-N-acetylenolpyruvoylglucosamine reductase, partial [Clostridia bacterium]|nr:UDP-N-acetylenolpyruvoylglucosamine reductase [Clostridia bacterium]